MNKIDLMIFDFDGTIADTGEDLVSAVNHTLKVMRLSPKSGEEILGFVGDGVRKLIERALGEKHGDCLDDALSVFTAYYENHLLDKTVCCPHIEEILKYFNHKIKVILTNKRYSMTLSIVRGLKLEKYFMEIIGADSLPFMKPDQRTVDYLLQKYNVTSRKAVIVGDGVNDIAVAKNAGILSCAYLNGLGSKEALLKMDADFYCEDLRELQAFFQ